MLFRDVADFSDCSPNSGLRPTLKFPDTGEYLNRDCPGMATMNHTIFARLLILTCVSTFSAPSVHGQLIRRIETGPNGVKVSKTDVEFEILLPERSLGSVDAQKWARIFADWKVPMRVRRSVLDEKPDVSERKIGTIRMVKVMGQMDRSGKIQFPGRSYSFSQTSKLKEWIEELQTYGAQGAPDGKPAWGLTAPQFRVVHGQLSKVTTKKTNGQLLHAVLNDLQVPGTLPISYTTDAVQKIATTDELPSVRQDVSGLSRGTALAIVLSEQGLCFRPRRTPAGGFQLQVDLASNVSDPWPAGWGLDTLKITRRAAAPKMFEMVPVQLNDASLLKVFDIVAQNTEVPIFVNDFALAEKNINPNTLTVNYPRKRTSWSLLLKSISIQQRLRQELVIDEKGKAFIWVTVFQPRKLKGE